MTTTKELTLKAKAMTQSEFGAALVSEARVRKQQKMLEKSLAEAQTIIASLDECNSKIEYFTGWKRTREAQLAALEAGAFKVDDQGVVTYLDEALNRK